MSEPTPLKLMLIAGEPSGDALGAQLMAGLREQAGAGVAFCGVGGPLMEAEGLTSLFSLADTSVMGLKEVVPKIPAILARVREAADFAIAERPDLVVLIDSPDFTHRIARRLKRMAPDIAIAKYVAPQVWASRPQRAKSLAEFVDYLLALLPFEPPFFEQHGLKTYFVGHPVIERMPVVSDTEVADFRTRHGLGADEEALVVLLGSRANEVRYLGPPFEGAVRQLVAERPGLRILIPTVPHIREKVEALTANWPGRPVLFDDPADKFISFKVAKAALAVSGTVTTEAALAGLPMVVAYKVGWLTAIIARRMMIAKYFTLLNLIADEEVIPEFLQEQCEPEILAEAVKPYLSDTDARRSQLEKVSAALKDLGVGTTSPSRRAAAAVLEIANQRAIGKS